MKSNIWKEHPAITEARRLLRARKGVPTEADRPKPASKPPRVLPGQLALFETTHDRDSGNAAPDQEGEAA
jgi:hypothetical protein